MLSTDTVVSCRLQTPEDENGKRDQLCPFTSSDEVFMNSSSGAVTNTTLSKKLAGMIPFEFQETRPKQPSLWIRPISEEGL